MDDKNRRGRLRFRSWHRGTNEMDLLMGHFADAYLPDFTPEQVAQYEAILDLQDPDLFNWITGVVPIPAEADSEVLRLLAAFQHARHNNR